MKSTILCSIIATALTFSTPSFAQDAKQPIAVVNIQQIMKESTAVKSVREQLESKQKSFQSILSKKDEEMQKEEQEIKKQKSVLSKEEFEKKAKAFSAKATEMQKDVQSKKAVLDGAFENSLNDIQKIVTEIIADIAKEKGFVVAMPATQILYSASSLDISAEVLERLNKKLPKLDVKFTAPEKK